MPSATYNVFRRAMLEEKLVSCLYNEQPRELCPVVLGYSEGEEKLLAFQVGGTNGKGQLVGGQWKCLRLANIRSPRAHAGEWREGARHSQAQTCVRDVDIDINIHVRKRRG